MADDLVERLTRDPQFWPKSSIWAVSSDAAAEIVTLRQLGDALAKAYRTLGGLDVAHDTALQMWEAARRGK